VPLKGSEGSHTICTIRTIEAQYKKTCMQLTGKTGDSLVLSTDIEWRKVGALSFVDCAALLAPRHLLLAATGTSKRARYERSIIPAVREMLMRRPTLSKSRQGKLFSPPAKLELPAKVRPKIVRLLARLLKNTCSTAQRSHRR
jgi:hypothetical protein